MKNAHIGERSALAGIPGTALGRSVGFVDLAAQYAEISGEVRLGLDDIFATSAYIGGPQVSFFERSYADFIGVNECVGVANGTDALELALRAAGVGPGAEVIVPANTFIATAEAISRCGATVVPVDVDNRYLLIDPEKVAEAVTEKTRAIIPVHLYGQCAFVEQLQEIADECGASIIEDAAQAQGASRFGNAAGAMGLLAATSFYPGKNLGAAGDAGAVLTNDLDLAQKVRTISAHGSRIKYEHERIGFNSRLDSVQAVVLNAKLARLKKWNAMRAKAAQRYSEMLGTLNGVVLPESAEGNLDAWHLYVVRVQRRREVMEYLDAAGIATGIHYPTPIHLTEAYRSLGFGRGSFPVSEAAAQSIMSLPMHPHLAEDDQLYVCEMLDRALGAT